MRKWIQTVGPLTCLFAVAVLALGCGGSDATGTPDSGTVTVQMIDDQFNSPQVHVAQNTTVHWVNNGSNAHTVTANDGAFDSGTTTKGGRFDHTFATKGTFQYHCNFHQGMTGTVVVE